ncbi:MAG: DUF6777 domain-containing protein [Candidatus Nanopelagicales bacterium]|nr:DUF6777 domain-containing protein [Candidatus Nanopelagicales bacterium]
MIAKIAHSALIAVGLSVLVACSSGTAPTPVGEVFLSAASDPGADPFTPSAANPSVTLGAASSATPSPAASGDVQSVTGTSPRVYAGSSTKTPCDKKKIKDSLGADAAKRAAWAGVIGIGTSDVDAYLKGAAAVVLRSDTRVTNHALTNGQARPFQAVLQAGTAVLVDSTGVPRVRCACGNPLAPPTAVTEQVEYTGTPWSGFDPGILVVIVPGPPQRELIVVDVDDGTDLTVPVDTPSDTPSPSQTGTSRPSRTSSPTVKPPTGTASPANYQNCAQQYAQLVIDLTLAHKITPAQAQQWAAQAENAAQAANNGNLAKAYQICEQTVSEMEQALNS